MLQFRCDYYANITPIDWAVAGKPPASMYMANGMAEATPLRMIPIDPDNDPFLKHFASQ